MTAVSAVRPAPVAPVEDWVLTAPWWHWPRQAPTPPDHTRPGLQKYAHPDFVVDFLADPQRRLVLDPVADRTTAPLFDPVTRTSVPASDAVLTKLYLPLHHRSYLVAVELHCDRPGLPNADRTAVCETGLVVRRRRADVPPEHVVEARRLQRALARAYGRVAILDRRLAAAAGRGRVGLSRATVLSEQRAMAFDQLVQARAAVGAWAEASGVQRRLEGWVPLGVDAIGQVVPLPERPGPDLRPVPGLGRWVPVDEVGGTLVEATFPMYPLIPDPRLPHHDATGRTIWFGSIPTMSTDLEHLDDAAVAAGQVDRSPRFDDFTTYEIRCVVRRHDPSCPRRPGTRDCHGHLTWSAPTDPYRLAAPMDARGTANRPVTVRMPTRQELADAAAMGTGFGGVRLQGSDYPLDGGPGFQICSFAIPLITIVATFVLRLFLPIVVFLFGLWLLLALKFCIPPSITVGADLDAALQAKAPSPDFEATFGVQVDAGLSAAGALMDGQSGSSGLSSHVNLTSALTSQPIEDKFAVLKALTAKSLKTPTDDLVYEARVDRVAVLGP